MDSKELRSLMEAYQQVSASQEAYLEVYGEGYKKLPYEKMMKKSNQFDKQYKTGPTKTEAEYKSTTDAKRRSSNTHLKARFHNPKIAQAKSAANKNRPESEKRSKTVKPKKSFPNRLNRSDGQGISDSYDYYDIILSHLIDEGYAETQKAAEAIMVNMSEEWRDIIVEELIAEISLKTKMGAYAASRDPDADYNYGSKVHDQGDRIKKAIVKKHGKKAGEHADAHAQSSAYGRTDSRTGKRQETARARSSSRQGKSYESQKRTTQSGKMHRADQKTLKTKLQKRASDRKSGRTSSTDHPSVYHN